ncbi:MAG: hypothetical protein FJ298_12140 [Planctomycetes bacterium]|nr:hypothetical protein [Planctomycetota bacterium]
MTKAAVALVPLALTSLLGGCRESAPEQRWLELTQVRPQDRLGVYLNERLVLHFSEALEPESVHGGSVRVLASDGAAARGRLSVEGQRIEFQPAPVLAADLADGGLRPATRYTVELAGFPRADGLRSQSGLPLASSLRWSFETVAVTEPRSGFVFEDSSPTSGSPVILRSLVIRPLQPIRLTCEEPIDPTTLRSEDFELVPEVALPGQGRTRGDVIPLVARLVRNDERQPYKDDAAVIELRPRDRLLAPGTYGLVPKRTVRLRDFGGHPLWVLNSSYREGLKLRVEPATGEDEGAITRHVESFLDARTLSTQAVSGADGSARWSGNGRVEVLFPAAAGRGRDGDVLLAAGDLPSRELHAATLSLASSTRVSARAAGAVVLRSQGRIELAGELRSERAESAADRATLEAALAAARARQGGRAPTVSEAIDALLEADAAVVVFVAGADLVISGSIELDRPLVLIAGGRIRLANERQLRVPRLLFLDAGTRQLGFTDVGGAPLLARAADLDWVLDPPSSNPLVRPLKLALVSSSIPPAGGAARWRSTPTVNLRAGAGAARVLYVGEHAPNAGSRAPDVVVDDPAALVDCPTVRLLVELEVFPGPSWDPPFVDDVTLEYEPLGPKRDR